MQATLTAARAAYNKRIVVAFQPHRYTRTRDLFHEFIAAFNQADVVIVTDIYAAGEAPIPGISGETLSQALREHGHQHVHYVADKAMVPDVLEGIVRSGDVVIAQGAGDINRAVQELHQRLQKKQEGNG